MLFYAGSVGIDFGYSAINALPAPSINGPYITSRLIGAGTATGAPATDIDSVAWYTSVVGMGAYTYAASSALLTSTSIVLAPCVLTFQATPQCFPQVLIRICPVLGTLLLPCSVGLRPPLSRPPFVRNRSIVPYPVRRVIRAADADSMYRLGHIDDKKKHAVFHLSCKQVPVLRTGRRNSPITRR